jgi:hypothetical protein
MACYRKRKSAFFRFYTLEQPVDYGHARTARDGNAATKSALPLVHPGMKSGDVYDQIFTASFDPANISRNDSICG